VHRVALPARAATPEQEAFIGNQAGGRVFLFLRADDFWRDYHAFTAKGVRFVRPPAEQPYGIVAVFEDIYGNHWDLIEPMAKTKLPATLPSTEPPQPAALSTPQLTRAAVRFGDRFAMEAETRMTPLGLLSIGGMVAAILLSSAVIVRAARGGKTTPRP
jgi:hypothetical protein